MVYFCLVPTCKNTSKVKKPNLDYFGVPLKDAQLRAAWFKAVKVQDPMSPDELRDRGFRDGRVVCSEHFASSDYERNLKDELLGITGRKKKLKPEAVPWLFLPPEEPGEEEVVEGNGPEVGVETRQTARENRSLGQNVRSPRSSKNLPKFGCLICSKPPVKKDYDTKHSLLGASVSDILNKQLWNVFVLEKVLGFPSVKCKKLLEKHGKTRHPFGWFHLCEGCANAAAKTMQMHEQILALQNRLKHLIKTLDGRLVRNLISQRDEKLKQTEAEVDLRNALREHKGLAPIVVVKLENLDDIEEISNTEMPYHHPDPTVSDIIRQKVDSLLKRNEDLLTSTKAIYGDIPTPISSKPTSNPINNESKSKSISASPRSGIVSSPQNAAEKSSQGQKILLLKPKQTNATKTEKGIRMFAVKVVQTAIAQSHSQTCEGTEVSSRTNAPQTTSSVNVILQRKAPLILRERTEAPFKSSKVPAAKAFPSGFRPAEVNPMSKEGNGESNSNLTYDPETSESVDVMRQNKHQRKVPHILREHEDATLRAHQYQCPICSTRLNTPVLYQNHLLLHKKSEAMQNEFDCPYCLYPFHNNLDLGRHLRKKHPSQMHSLKKVCDICGFTVPKVLESKWKTHVLQHKIHDFQSDRPGEYGCTFCDEYFTTKHKLSRHKRLEHAHELGVDCFLCTDCGRTFLTKASLDTHISVHHSEENEFICELCGTRLSTAHALRWHLKKHNTNQQKNDDKCVCICIKCNLQFKNLASLQDHHYHQINFYGHVLSDDGKNSIRRKGRGRTHPLSLVPQKCKYCNTTLPHFAALRRHLKIHSKFKCSICGNAYMTKDNMYKHKRRMHSTGDTRARCRYCNKEFQHRMNIFGHYGNCSGVRKLSSDANCITCELCNRGFRNKSGYNGHLHLCKKTAVLASGSGESSRSNTNGTTIDNDDTHSEIAENDNNSVESMDITASP